MKYAKISKTSSFIFKSYLVSFGLFLILALLVEFVIFPAIKRNFDMSTAIIYNINGKDVRFIDLHAAFPPIIPYSLLGLLLFSLLLTVLLVVFTLIESVTIPQPSRLY